MALLMANPIYSCVFKYLLDDAEIAREFLSAILGQEVIKLDVLPFQMSDELRLHTGNVFRIEAEALLETGASEPQPALIEVRKAKHRADTLHFLHYLAGEFGGESPLLRRGSAIEGHPVVAIYFLGFKLAAGYPAAFKTEQHITELLTGEKLPSLPGEPIVELMPSGSYVIQFPLLGALPQDSSGTRLEQVLRLFNQEHRGKYPHLLRRVNEPSDPLAKKMADRLTLAVAEEQMATQIDIEGELERTLGEFLREKCAIIDDEIALRKRKEEFARKMAGD